MGEHVRRVRYSGTHPKRFEEKYKEHNPEKYKDTIEKVISKGSTPAGMHISIMVDEILQVLQIQPGEQGLDATLGYGGHTEKMLEQLKGNGHMYALDVDPIEMEKTKERLKAKGYGEEILTICRKNFAYIDEVAQQYGKFDFILADLGVSSMQIDNPERGFSYKVDAPLDLRLNPTEGISAAECLKNLSKEDFISLMIENSDEPYAEEIAKAVWEKKRRKEPVETTFQLKDAIEKALIKVPQAERKQAVKKSCQRVFQALRIEVNSEFEVLQAFLEKLPQVLNPGARVAILTFHSGEDRMVKKIMKEHFAEGLYEEISKDVTRPSKEERIRNPRAASTKLRYAVRSK